MSDSEKFEAHGRAHATLKDAKSAVATSKAVLMEYSDRLEAVNRNVKKFIADPLHKSDSHILLAEQLKAQIRGLFVALLDEQIDELAYATQKVATLEEHIEKF
jgi:hypothetical protein